MVHTLPMKTLEQITLFNDIYILYKYVCFGAFSYVYVLLVFYILWSFLIKQLLHWRFFDTRRNISNLRDSVRRDVQTLREESWKIRRAAEYF